MQIPHCLAFEYLKSMISVGLSSIHCGGFDLDFVAKGERTMRCLCIGLGGGSLPIFLANKLQGCHVDVVEIDDTVISAAIDCMGFPKIEFKTFPSDLRSETLNAMCDESHMEVKLGVESLSHTQCYDIPRRIASSMLEFPLRISGFEADAVMYVGHLAGAKQSQQHYDLVFIDAFNGEDEVPVDFWTRGGSFLTGLRDLLDPHHGTVVVNLHTDLPPPSFLERITGNFGPGYDPLLPGGKRLQEISQAYRDKLLHCWSAGLSEDEICGATFTVAVPRQQNICLVVCRGIRGTEGNIIDNLSSAALSLENILHVPFPMSKRATRGFQLVHG
ncbi:hypothetical protein KP509_09G068900 [Ceratopteris richardii]|nr:hypothetical protein KP509_09G068900 [Ceratopteris richardii]